MSVPPNMVLVLPPLDEYGLVGNWMATVLYGMNILLYGSCIYIVAGKQAKGYGHWLLISTCTALFMLATLQVGACLRQLIEAFVFTPKLGIPGGSLLYWISLTPPVNVVKSYAYLFADCIQDYVLVWRLYVVWNDNWRVALVPLVLEIAHTVLGTYETILTTKTGALPARGVAILTWSLVLVVNVTATFGIAGRLWYMGHRLYGTTSISTGNKYWAAVMTMVESGALFSSSVVVLVALFAANSALLGPAVTIAVQLAVLSPFLIIVRIGFGLTHGIGSFGKKRYQSTAYGSSAHTGSGTVSTRVNIFRSAVTDTTTDSVMTDGEACQLDEFANKPHAKFEGKV